MKNIEMLKENSREHFFGNEKSTSKDFYAKITLSRIQSAEHGRIKITLPNEQTVCHIGSYQGHTVAIHFKTWKSIFQYILYGQLSFVEAYINGFKISQNS